MLCPPTNVLFPIDTSAFLKDLCLPPSPYDLPREVHITGSTVCSRYNFFSVPAHTVRADLAVRREETIEKYTMHGKATIHSQLHPLKYSYLKKKSQYLQYSKLFSYSYFPQLFSQQFNELVKTGMISSICK